MPVPARLAQLVEHSTDTRAVLGSNPRACTRVDSVHTEAFYAVSGYTESMKDRLIVIVLAGISAIGALVVIAAHAPEHFSAGSDQAAVATNTAIATDTAMENIVPVTILAEGSQSAVTTRENYRIVSASELSELWSELRETGAPPPVDFSRYDVLALFAGTSPSAGYTIGISKAVDTATARMVYVSLGKPAGSCMSAQVVTTPYLVVLVPHSALPLSHEDATVAVPCASGN